MNRPLFWLACCITIALLLAFTADAIRRPHERRRTHHSGRSLLVEEHESANFARLLEEDPVPDPTSADDHLITSLPGLDNGDFPSKHWAGLLTVDKSSIGKLFYWLFEADKDPQEKPLIIWLNGGPGCSSMDGLFLENGPFKVDDSMKISVNPYSWHKAANILYIDQPVGTGYSFTGKRNYCSNDDCINTNMYTFLQAFFQLHSWLLKKDDRKKSRPIFFTGESQAGHYIPTMADHILKQNKNLQQDGQIFLDVQGLAIGNGWVDPPNQYDVSDFAHGVGMISEGQYHTLQRANEECKKELSGGSLLNAICFNLLDEVVAATGTDSTGFVSLYDYRFFDSLGDRQFPPGHKTVEKYLNKKEVKEALHAGESPMVFQECTDPPYDHLKHQDGLGVTAEVVRILEENVRVLFFNGVYDVICNHVGNEKAIMDLEWSGKEAYVKASRSVWMPKDRSSSIARGGGGAVAPGGYAKSSGLLTFLQVLNAGHMVPLDVPSEALDMITRFVQGKAFSDGAQAISMSAAPPAIECASAPAQVAGPKPATPSVKEVKALEDGTVQLVLAEESSPTTVSKNDDFYYTVLVNPGGSLLVPSVDVKNPKLLTLTELEEGIEYSLQVIANIGGEASRPSEPAQRLVLGCSSETPTCQHGLCGYDVEGKQKRCFCYQGWTGSGCSTSDSAGNKGSPAESSSSSSNGKEQVRRGRVTYEVDKSCASTAAQSCALRFTVPLRVFKENKPSTLSEEENSLGGPEEVRALQGILSRDLVQALGVEKDQVALISVHPFGGESSKASLQRNMALTFDILSSPNPPHTVEVFKSLWVKSEDESPLRFGLLTSNFDIQQDAQILLIQRDGLSAAHGGVDENQLLKRYSPLRRSLTIGLVALAMILLLVYTIVRYTKRAARRAGSVGGLDMLTGNMSTGSAAAALGPGIGGGSTTGIRMNRRHRRQSSTSSVEASEDLGLSMSSLDGDDDDVEVMEVRSSTEKHGASNSISRLAGLGSNSRSSTIDDGASERLV